MKVIVWKRYKKLLIRFLKIIRKFQKQNGFLECNIEKSLVSRMLSYGRYKIKMCKEWNSFPEMWNWSIGDGEGWFVEYRMNILCRYDMQNKIISIVSAIPTNIMQPFQNPWCIKYGNLVYCIPEYGNCIWCYNILFSEWRVISVVTNQENSIMAVSLGRYREIYYFYSINFGCIYGLELKTGKIYSYCINMKDEICIYTGGVLVGDSAYFIFEGNIICEFDLNIHKEIRYDLTHIDDEVCEIGSDGRLFFLTGKKKKVYIWDKRSNEVDIIDELPGSFAIYDFWEKREVIDCNDIKKSSDVFSAIIYVSNKVWLIPKTGSQILYYDQSDRKINKFNIQDEDESEETLDLHFRLMAIKFYLLYVRKQRFLGIYSYKNKCVLEIDSVNMSYKRLDFLIDKCSLLKLPILYFHEGNGLMSDLIYKIKIECSDLLLKKQDIKSTGKEIFTRVCN